MAFKADWILLAAGAALVVPAVAVGADGERYDPYAKMPSVGRYEYDMREILAQPDRFVAEPVEQPDFSRLGQLPLAAEPPAPGQLPEGWVQLGEVVQRKEIAEGLKQIDPKPLPAWEDVEGNQYPRKGTVFLNFNGGMLKSGDDNSAENKSMLAKHNHMYPVYGYSEASALALIQAVMKDMEAIGVRVVYEKRPSKTVPYTMAMVSGNWTDTNIGSPAGGVAPGTDCEDRDQRNVVYAFDNSAATVSQEIAHAWGLDHTLGSDRIMSYQAGLDKHFGDNCQALCEEQCQGPGSIGCRLIHEIYCGEDSEQQNDLAELKKIFGTTEPDTEPPTVEIEPAGDVLELVTGSSVDIKAKVHDNYGGVGWRIKVIQDGTMVFDQVDYDRVGGWHFSNLANGTYEVILEAEDHADHVVQDKLTILVSADGGGGTTGTTGTTGDPAPTTGPTTGSRATDPDNSTGGGSTTGSDDESGTTAPIEPLPEDGCGCRQQDSGPGALGLPLVGVWLAHRARRRRRS